MNTLLARAQQIAAKVAHNPVVLAEVIAAGVVPAGATVGTSGDMTLVFTGTAVEGRKADGSVARTMPIADQAAHDNVLVQYAVHSARIGSGTRVR